MARHSGGRVNFAFGEMSRALERGETVEFPFGHLERVRYSHRKQRGWFLNRIALIYKKPYTVRHREDAAGRYLLDETVWRSKPPRASAWGA